MYHNSIAEAFPIHRLFNFIYRAFDSALNPNRDEYIETIFKFIAACFDADPDSSPDYKFGIVVFFRSESWKLIDDKIESLFAAIVSKSPSNPDMQTLIKTAIVQVWKMQVQIIRANYHQLQKIYKNLKEQEKKLIELEQPNHQNFNFTTDLVTNSIEMLKRQSEKQDLENKIHKNYTVITQMKANLNKLRENLWNSITYYDKNIVFFNEGEDKAIAKDNSIFSHEKGKYAELLGVIKRWETHFQVPFDDAVDSTQVNLDEAKVVPVCVVPREGTEEQIKQIARQAVKQPAIKGVAIYPGMLQQMGDMKEFTFYYYQAQKPIIEMGFETPQLSTPDQGLTETRFKGNIKTLTDLVYKKLPEDPRSPLQAY